MSVTGMVGEGKKAVFFVEENELNQVGQSKLTYI